MNSSRKEIAIVGLGYVGLPLAVELGRLRNVIGFDIDAKRVSELSNGTDRTKQLAKNELLKAKSLLISPSNVLPYQLM